MNPESILAGTASLFLALGDKTRLRLLNLMRDREVCVSSFTGVLEQSQPLISRHLAYLRNSGLVEARRDGKWMHYSVSAQLDENTARLLFELFKWMDQQDGLRVDRDRYFEISGETPSPAATPDAGEPRPRGRSARRTRSTKGQQEGMEYDAYSPEPEPELDHYQTAEPESDDYRPARHNELEDFLL